MTFREFTKVVLGTAKQIQNQEKFVVAELAVRAENLAQNNPYDATAVSMSNFLRKRANKDLLISRQELRGTYQGLYSRNNCFAEAFEKELGLESLAGAKVMERVAGEESSLVEDAYRRIADPVLAGALSAAFEKDSQNKLYSADLAKRASRVCLHELNSMKLPPKKVEVVAGQSDVLLCMATYETPKGNTSALIPVEVRDNVALIPTILLTTAGFVDLAKEALESHLTATAGKSFRVDPSSVLKAIASVKNPAQEQLNELDMIIVKAKIAEGAANSQVHNGIIYQPVDQVVEELSAPETEETHEFASKLSSAKGAAEFLFTPQTVDLSRKLVSKALDQFGYKAAKIAVADADQNNIFFAVSLDNQIGFKLAVAVENKKPNLPGIFVAAGSVYEFSRQGVNQAMADNASDGRMLATASPLFALSARELVNEVEKSMVQGNLARAEDALNVLAESNNPESYRMAVSLYMSGLGGKLEKAAENCTCNMQRKVAYSKYTLCGHTNLPVHKVYQDKNGDCQPLYRKNIAEAESASFMHSKVYFG